MYVYNLIADTHYPACFRELNIRATDLHCALATFVTALNKLVSKPEDSLQVMRHLSRSLQLTNARLSGNAAISTVNIAVVVIMAQLDLLRGREYQGLVHVRGLCRMVELRGGIQRLAIDRPALVQKIFK